MAKLFTPNEKYGVAIASRIETKLATDIAKKAEILQLSFSKTVALVIAQGLEEKRPIIIDNRQDIEKLDENYRILIGEFIREISKGDEYRERELIKTFKEIRDSNEFTNLK